MLASCSSNMSRIKTSNLYHVMQSKNTDIVDYLTENSRNDVAYDRYTSLLRGWALYRDLRFRKIYLDERVQSYYLRDTDRADYWAHSKMEYDNFYDFIVVLNSDSGDVNFGVRHSEWQAYLQDSEGTIIYASQIKKVNKKDYLDLFLEKYFVNLNAWSTIYEVRFPKFKTQQNKANIELVISSVKAKLNLNWENSSMFFEKEYDILPK